jgi:hypothetical protein
MPEPKWVIAMGACASTGGMYRSYAVLQGIDQLLPWMLHFRLSAAARGVDCGPDEAAGQDLRREVIRRAEAPTAKTIRGRALVTGPELLSSLDKVFGQRILSRTDFRGETTFEIAREHLREIAQFCRDEMSFDYLLDVSSVDNFGEDPRFEVVYDSTPCRSRAPAGENSRAGG